MRDDKPTRGENRGFLRTWDWAYWCQRPRLTSVSYSY